MKCIFENLPQVNSRCSKRYSTEFVYLVLLVDRGQKLSHYRGQN